MGSKVEYENFLKSFDIKLKEYFDSFGDNICCRKGCSDCCEKGDYPMSDIELEYLMFGYQELETDIQKIIKQNIKNMEKGGQCPFLINKECSVYTHRPIICRVHGLAYYSDKKVMLPYCANNGKNFAKIYKDGEFWGKPIALNLDTAHILEDIYYDIRDLYDWLKKTK